ncbi:MAG TPA: sulfotransferase [Gaiellaceae bacterium]|nr:sulfotransferase [Gaiellaceae bacterium]
MKRLARGLRALPLRGRPAVLVERVAGRLDRGRTPAPPPPADELRQLAKQRFRRRVPVTQPLVLVSQIHRSGGTLLARLFDGHPALYAIPHELGPLVPAGPVPLDARGAWELLHDPKLEGRFHRGLRQQRRSINRDTSHTSFVLPPSVHRLIFERILESQPPAGERDVLDAYLTAYFNGWLDYHGGLDPAKRWVTGFEPGLLLSEKRVDTFRRLYPDGRLISIVREPASWYASARVWDERYAKVDVALDFWRRSVDAAERLARELGERCLILDFDALVSRTEETMGEVARFLDIELTPELLAPTVNGVAFGANSSFASEERGTVQQGSSDRASVLTAEERDEVSRVLERLRAG